MSQLCRTVAAVISPLRRRIASTVIKGGNHQIRLSWRRTVWLADLCSGSGGIEPSTSRSTQVNCCFMAIHKPRSLAPGSGREMTLCRQFKVIARQAEQVRPMSMLNTFGQGAHESRRHIVGQSITGVPLVLFVFGCS